MAEKAESYRMKVLGIGGSPRVGGNSDLLLDETLRGSRAAGASTEKIVLNRLRFRPCQECGGCDDTGVCVIKDDMRLLYKKVLTSDAVVMASPIFFGSLSGQAKMMIDRFHCLWVERRVLGKKPKVPRKIKGALLLTSGARKKEFFENAENITKNFFATLGAEYSGGIFCGGVERKDEIRKNKRAMLKAFRLGKTLAGK